MAKFRRKAVEVEAVQFDPNVKPWPEGVIEHGGHWSDRRDLDDPGRHRYFGFLSEGRASSKIRPDDWIVTNQTGERYVVLKESFAATYSAVK